MKAIKISFAVLISSILVCALVFAAEKKQELTAQERAHLAFYVYADFKSILNHYYPAGWMGDSKDLALNQGFNKYPYAGKECIRVIYKPGGGNRWAGVYWQQPANNWGDKEGGFDLTGASHVTFWLKGETGGEVIQEIRIGGFKGKFPDSSTAYKRHIKLTNSWKLYYIDLKNKDMSRIAGGFSFVVNRKDNPNGCTFYIDEVRYEMSK